MRGQNEWSPADLLATPVGLVSAMWSSRDCLLLPAKMTVFSPDKIYKTSYKETMRVPECQFIFLTILEIRNGSFSFVIPVAYRKEFYEPFFKIHFSFSWKKEMKNKYFDFFFKIFGKNENENFTNSFLNFRKQNKMEILLFKVIIQFWKKNENWNSFANSTFIPSLMSSRDRRPGDAPTTWCLLPLQRWLSGILPSTWSSSQRGEREGRMERKLTDQVEFRCFFYKNFTLLHYKFQICKRLTAFP